MQEEQTIFKFPGRGGRERKTGEGPGKFGIAPLIWFMDLSQLVVIIAITSFNYPEKKIQVTYMSSFKTLKIDTF